MLQKLILALVLFSIGTFTYASERLMKCSVNKDVKLYVDDKGLFIYNMEDRGQPEKLFFKLEERMLFDDRVWFKGLGENWKEWCSKDYKINKIDMDNLIVSCTQTRKEILEFEEIAKPSYCTKKNIDKWAMLYPDCYKALEEVDDWIVLFCLDAKKLKSCYDKYPQHKSKSSKYNRDHYKKLLQDAINQGLSFNNLPWSLEDISEVHLDFETYSIKVGHQNYFFKDSSGNKFKKIHYMESIDCEKL